MAIGGAILDLNAAFEAKWNLEHVSRPAAPRKRYGVANLSNPFIVSGQSNANCNKKLGRYRL